MVIRYKPDHTKPKEKKKPCSWWQAFWFLLFYFICTLHSKFQNNTYTNILKERIKIPDTSHTHAYQNRPWQLPGFQHYYEQPTADRSRRKYCKMFIDIQPTTRAVLEHWETNWSITILDTHVNLLLDEVLKRTKFSYEVNSCFAVLGSQTAKTKQKTECRARKTVNFIGKCPASTGSKGTWCSLCHSSPVFHSSIKNTNTIDLRSTSAPTFPDNNWRKRKGGSEKAVARAVLHSRKSKSVEKGIEPMTQSSSHSFAEW